MQLNLNTSILWVYFSFIRCWQHLKDWYQYNPKNSYSKENTVSIISENKTYPKNKNIKACCWNCPTNQNNNSWEVNLCSSDCSRPILDEVLTTSTCSLLLVGLGGSSSINVNSSSHLGSLLFFTCCTIKRGEKKNHKHRPGSNHIIIY